MNKKDQILAIKAYKRESRLQEIIMFGHAINYCSIQKNKKKYTRKLKHKNNYE